MNSKWCQNNYSSKLIDPGHLLSIFIDNEYYWKDEKSHAWLEFGNGPRSMSGQRSVTLVPIYVMSLGLFISKYINSDKNLPKMPKMWNLWPKNAKCINTVSVTLFQGMLPQKRKYIFKGLLFLVMHHVLWGL